MEKPTCKLIGEDSNVFSLMGKVSKTLNNAGLTDKAKEMTDRVFDSGSYDEALTIFRDYVEVE